VKIDIALHDTILYRNIDTPISLHSIKFLFKSRSELEVKLTLIMHSLYTIFLPITITRFIPPHPIQSTL